MQNKAHLDFHWVLYATAVIFVKCCGVSIENSFALFSSLFKEALERTQVICIK